MQVVSSPWPATHFGVWPAGQAMRQGLQAPTVGTLQEDAVLGLMLKGREIKKMMPFASYGQGPVLVTPFKMARVAATIADGGMMPQGRWVVDSSNSRTDAARAHHKPGGHNRIVHEALKIRRLEGHRCVIGESHDADEDHPGG